MGKINMHMVTKRLVISHFEASDINESYLSWLNDSNFMKYSEQKYHHHDRVTAENYLDSFDFKNSYLLALKYEKQLIGTATVYLRFYRGRAIGNLGLLIGKQFTKKNFGLEAWVAIKNMVGRDQLPITIFAGTKKENLAMNRIAVNSGMKILVEDTQDIDFDKQQFNFDAFNYYFENFESF